MHNNIDQRRRNRRANIRHRNIIAVGDGCARPRCTPLRVSRGGRGTTKSHSSMTSSSLSASMVAEIERKPLRVSRGGRHTTKTHSSMTSSSLSASMASDIERKPLRLSRGGRHTAKTHSSMTSSSLSASMVAEIERKPDNKGESKSLATYKKGMDVFYRTPSGPVPVRILEVHFDDFLEPYYTILRENGTEKQTDNDHLSLFPDPCEQETKANETKLPTQEEIQQSSSSDLSQEGDMVKPQLDEGSQHRDAMPLDLSIVPANIEQETTKTNETKLPTQEEIQESSSSDLSQEGDIVKPQLDEGSQHRDAMPLDLSIVPANIRLSGLYPFDKQIENTDSKDNSPCTRRSRTLSTERESVLSFEDLKVSIKSLELSKKEVNEFRCCDADGSFGFFTGTISEKNNVPHGNGQMIYDSGKIAKGDWSGGTLKVQAPTDCERYEPFLLKEYSIGDAGRDTDMVKATTEDISKLHVGDCSFVRRSDGSWTYAIVVSRSDVADTSITLKVKPKGSTKTFEKDQWAGFLRLPVRKDKVPDYVVVDLGHDVIQDSIPDYDVGDPGHEGDMIIASQEETVLLATKLKVGDAVFVRRSNGSWSYATVSDKRYGDDPEITFKINSRGCTKSIALSRCGKLIRHIKKHLQGQCHADTEEAEQNHYLPKNALLDTQEQHGSKDQDVSVTQDSNNLSSSAIEGLQILKHIYDVELSGGSSVSSNTSRTQSATSCKSGLSLGTKSRNAKSLQT